MSIQEFDLEKIRKLVFDRTAAISANNPQTESQTEMIYEDENFKPNDFSRSVHLSLKINPDYESMSYMNTFNVQNILNRHSIFKSSNIIGKTSINENFIIYISLLKSNIYQKYRINIPLSRVLKNNKERLENGKFIREDQLIDSETNEKCFKNSLIEFKNWLKIFVKSLPGFDKFDDEDFQSIIDSAATLLLGVHLSEFHKNDESFIIAENVQLTKARYIQLFGETLSEYIFKFHSSFNQLKLTDYELVLFYTFILSNVNTNIVKDKICLLQMKAKYTRAMIYEFELSKKNAYFYQQFSEVNFNFKVYN